MSEWRSHKAWLVPAECAQTAPDNLCAEEIHRQLKRVLASPQFHDSLRLTRFLSFVVETTLAGKADHIKAYTIAVGALGRASDFDPQHDAIVRVEAGRLRQALARYYAKDGRHDDLVIDVPRGSYVPVFYCATAVSAAPDGPPGIKERPDAEATTSWPDPVAWHRESELLLETVSRQSEELAARIQTASRALKDSQALLRQPTHAAATECPAPAPPMAPSADAVAVITPDDGAEARGISAPASDVELEQPRAVPTNHAFRVFSTAAKNRLRKHGGIFGLCVAIVALAAILIIASDIGQLSRGDVKTEPVFKHGSPAAGIAAQTPTRSDEPVIYVEPVISVGEQPPERPSPSAIRDRMIDALARFDDVIVTAYPPPDVPGPAAASSAPDSAPASYYDVSSTVHYTPDGGTRFLAQLTDSADGTIVWSKSYDTVGRGDPNHKGGKIAADLAQTLLNSIGIIQARERVKRAAANNLQDPYRCLLDANRYLRNLDPALFASVHNCLLRATADDPPLIGVVVKLARVYLRDYQFGDGRAEPGDPTTLDRAYRMAARAINLKPNSATAQFAMEQILLAKGDIVHATEASESALRLNPNDSAVIFGRASLLILLGRIDDGVAALSQNTATTPQHWTNYHFLLALAAYLKGEFKTAAHETGEITNDYFPPGLILEAIVAARAGELARAHNAVALLEAKHPSYLQHIRANIGVFLPDHAMADRIAADYAATVANLTN